MDVVLKHRRFATANSRHYISKLLVQTVVSSLCVDALYLGKVSAGEDIEQAGLSACAITDHNELLLSL